MTDTIYNLVKRAEENLTKGKPIKIGKYATHDHSEKISTIDAYLNSQHISGKYDTLDREKPFFNIVLAAVYTWYKATDIDRKHIKFRAPNKKQRMKTLIATILLREWMLKTKFGLWLNKWGYKLGCYGSIPTKFIEKEGKLHAEVISWDRMICDPVDFEGNPKIEKLYLTPDQLRQQPYKQDEIEKAITAFENGGDIRKNLEGEDVDLKNEYIGLYEVHGNLPLYYLTGKETDKTVYRQQMHVIFIQKGEKKEDDVELTLYSGKEAKDPYYLTYLIESEGRTLSVGAVESLFDPQWMVNHSAKQIKDQLDLASKLLTQTSDSNFLGRNVMTDNDTGEVLIHAEGQPLTQVNTQSHDIPQIMNYLTQWKQLAREISGAHESITGESMPSGTAFRLGAMLNTEAMGLFDIMRENKGLHLENIIRTYVLPHFKKTLKNSNEVVALLDGQELEDFDELSMPANLEAELRSGLMQGRIPTAEELMTIISEKKQGNSRSIRPSADKKMTWAEYFKDFDLDALDIEITGENRDKAAVMTTLNSILQTIASNPAILENLEARKILNKILDEVGPDILSPLQFKKQGALPQMGTTGGMPAKTGQGEVGAPAMEMATT
jgi:hypothetical protein